MKIETEIRFPKNADKDGADTLSAKLTEAGVDASVGWSQGRWTVFASYSPDNAILVAGEISALHADLKGRNTNTEEGEQ